MHVKRSGRIIVAILVAGSLLSAWGCSGTPVSNDHLPVQVGFKADQEGTSQWNVQGLVSVPTSVRSLYVWAQPGDTFQGASPVGYNAPTVVADGSIYVPDSGVTAFKQDGTVLWHVTLGAASEGPVVIAGAYLYVVAGEMNPDNPGEGQDRLWCLEAASGRTVWKTEVIGHSAGVASGRIPVIADGKVFLPVSELTETDVQTYGGWMASRAKGKTYIAMWNAASGKVLDKILATPWDSLLALATATCSDGRTVFFAGPAARDGKVETLVQALDARSGKTLWSRSVLPVMSGYGALALAGDVLLFEAIVTTVSPGTKDQQARAESLHAMAFSATTGAMLWEQELPANILPSAQSARITVVGSTTYMPTRSGRIVAMDAKTGHRVWEKQLPGFVGHSFDESTQKTLNVEWNDAFLLAATPDVLYVIGQSSGVVRALRLTDGAILWERATKYVVGVCPVERGLLVLHAPYVEADRSTQSTRLELWQ
jgi:outer membrane protein assembly factor BamB